MQTLITRHVAETRGTRARRIEVEGNAGKAGGDERRRTSAATISRYLAATTALCLLLLGPAVARAESTPEELVAEAALLTDAVAAEELTDEVLRARIGKTRELLDSADVTPEISRALRALLKADRAVLRARVAASTTGSEAGEAPDTGAATDSEASEATEAPVDTEEEPAETTVSEPDATTVTEPDATTVTEPDATTVTEPEEATAPEPAETTDSEPVETYVSEPVETSVSEPAETTVSEPAETTEAETGVLSKAEASAAELLADATPADELSNKALRARIEVSRDVLNGADVSPATSRALRARLKADRAVLRARVAANSTAEADVENTEAEAVTTGETKKDVSPEAEARAVSLLADETPADDLSDEALRARAGMYRDLLGEANVSLKVSRALRARLKADRAVLRLRKTAKAEAATVETGSATVEPAAEAAEVATKVSPEAETAAAVLVADATPADELTNKALRARVEKYRELLRESDLSPETSRALRARLKADRAILRARVAAKAAAKADTKAAQAEAEQRAATDEEDDGLPVELLAVPAVLALIPMLQYIDPPAEDDIAQILLDQRPSQALTDQELNRRILAYQSPQAQAFSETERMLLESWLEADRAALHERLLTRRVTRADAYAQYYGSEDYDPDFLLPINVSLPEETALAEIWAAEESDTQIWQQLIAAPLVPVRYHFPREIIVSDTEAIVTEPWIRESLPSVELDTVTFGTNESFVREEQIYHLDRIARLIEQVVSVYPEELFLIEGHTDAVGAAAYNLPLSRERAEAIKMAIIDYYLVPPENLVTAGLGESDLKIWTPEAEQENRRVTVRRITPLVTGYAYE